TADDRSAAGPDPPGPAGPGARRPAGRAGRRPPCGLPQRSGQGAGRPLRPHTRAGAAPARRGSPYPRGARARPGAGRGGGRRLADGAGPAADRQLVLAVLLGGAVAAALLFLTASVVPRAQGRLRPTVVLIRWRGLLRAVRVLLGDLALALGRLVARPRAAADADDPTGSAAQARRTVDRALENEHLHSSARGMIQGIFELGDSMVRELMVPRTDMVTVGADTPAHKAMRLFVRSGFSRV